MDLGLLTKNLRAASAFPGRVLFLKLKRCWNPEVSLMLRVILRVPAALSLGPELSHGTLI